tara:strand:- start:150 stop:959 length:810 start_codon:yes stop_codon:yes gene_type:complete
MARSIIKPSSLDLNALSYVIALNGGGEITIYSLGGVNYRVHTFLDSGTLTLIDAKNVDVLLVAGGGSGASYGSNGNGGGGAGGMVVGTAVPFVAGTYAITIGAGAASVNNAYGLQGQDSTIVHSSGTVTAKGGGGGHYGSIIAQNNGGSGGGGGNNSTGTTTSTQTNQTLFSTTLTGFGNPQGPPPSGGYGTGGAGAGGQGGAAATTPNVGGVGLANAFRTGSNITYAAGGPSANSGATGAPNTGNGGGGNYTASGAGGSGICVIRYVV